MALFAVLLFSALLLLILIGLRLGRLLIFLTHNRILRKKFCAVRKDSMPQTGAFILGFIPWLYEHAAEEAEKHRCRNTAGGCFEPARQHAENALRIDGLLDPLGD